MTTLDVAAKGTPSLVYSASIVTDFVKQLKLLPEITESFHNTSSLVGKASVSLTAVDGSTFHDWDLLNHLSKLASDDAGFPTISIMSSPRNDDFPLTKNLAPRCESGLRDQKPYRHPTSVKSRRPSRSSMRI
jgi:hypothetical protein